MFPAWVIIQILNGAMPADRKRTAEEKTMEFLVENAYPYQMALCLLMWLHLSLFLLILCQLIRRHL